MRSRMPLQPPECAWTISSLGRRSCVMTISVPRPRGVEVDGHERAVIAGERRVPGEDDAARARDLLVRARVRDRALGRVHDDLELAADARVELHVRALGVEGAHPARELGGIEPGVEELGGGRRDLAADDGGGDLCDCVHFRFLCLVFLPVANSSSAARLSVQKRW